MDILALILRSVQDTIARTGVPPDALQDSIAELEHSLRRSYGGATHHISRLPPARSAKVRILDLHGQGLSSAQIAQRVGCTDRYVRMVVGAVEEG